MRREEIRRRVGQGTRLRAAVRVFLILVPVGINNQD